VLSFEEDMAVASEKEQTVGVNTIAEALAEALGKANDRQDRKRDRNNPDYKGVSPFRPMGSMTLEGTSLGFRRSVEVNGQADYQPWHNGAKIRLDLLDPTEIAAWNKLADSLLKPGDKRTARNGKWYATVQPNGDLLVVTPCMTEDDRAEVNAVPNIRLLLRELMEGNEAVNPESLADQVATLTARLAALEGKK
jgi:hypothetical protein